MKWQLKACAFALLICCLSAAARAERVKIIYSSGADAIAMFPYHPTPTYPKAARLSRTTGSGIFRIYVNPDGTVKTVGVIKSTGSSVLDLAAAAGLYKWRAHPGKRREVDMPVTFVLNRI